MFMSGLMSAVCTHYFFYKCLNHSCGGSLVIQSPFTYINKKNPNVALVYFQTTYRREKWGILPGLHLKREGGETERERESMTRWWSKLAHGIQLCQISDLPETSQINLARFVLLPARSLPLSTANSNTPHPFPFPSLYHLLPLHLHSSCPSLCIHTPPFLFFLHSCHKSNLCNVKSVLFH